MTLIWLQYCWVLWRSWGDSRTWLGGDLSSSGRHELDVPGVEDSGEEAQDLPDVLLRELHRPHCILGKRSWREKSEGSSCFLFRVWSFWRSRLRGSGLSGSDWGGLVSLGPDWGGLVSLGQTEGVWSLWVQRGWCFLLTWTSWNVPTSLIVLSETQPEGLR